MSELGSAVAPAQQAGNLCAEFSALSPSTLAALHVEVAVAPVRVFAQVLGENRAEGWLVFGHQPRPLLEHEAQGLRGEVHW